MNKLYGRFFTEKEMGCRGVDCCGHSAPMNPELMVRLNRLRVLLRSPVMVHSGFRCAIHNARVGGVPDSYHKLGMACDISCSNSSVEMLHASAESIFSQGGVGLYDEVVHVDVRDVLGVAKARWDFRKTFT